MLCPLCGKKNPPENSYCASCTSALLPENNRSRALRQYLTENGFLPSEEDLLKTVSLTVRITSDDGLIAFPEPEMTEEIPLYFNKNDIVFLALRTRGAPEMSLDYYHIREFLNASTYGKEKTLEEALGRQPGPRPRVCGDLVLAEVMPFVKEQTLHLTVAHRAAMVNRIRRTEPNACLYGCPAASDLQQRDADTEIRTEVVTFDEP